MEIDTTADDLETREHIGQNEVSKCTHLCLDGSLRNVFAVRFIPNKVRPPGTNFGIIDATSFELQAKICINSKEIRV
jgi:hypothetical protein